VFSPNIAEKSCDKRCILFQITAGMEWVEDDHGLRQVIERAKNDWNSCAESNVIKSRFPFVGFLAGALRGYGEHELLLAVDLTSDLFNEIGFLAAVYRYSTKSAE